jgi:biopolymer transport protein ExbD
MDRHHKRGHRSVALNLVSLMDIFTILVFFLLVNSSDVQELPTRSVQMPESVSEQKPRETVVVVVNRDGIMVQGRLVISMDDALAQEGNILEPLKLALVAQTGRLIDSASNTDKEVTIVGDRELPYQLLRKVMATCTEADYGRVSLAVMQKTPESAGRVAS